ncbi:T9SS type A sorting domain-containing protein [Bacteroidota bacterium]
MNFINFTPGLASGTTEHLNGINFIDSETGWAVGGNKILKTTNGGITTSVEETETKSVADNFYLSQNYPNPFNPSTKIKYSIPKQNIVTLKVFDVLGGEVATLVNKEHSQGNYEIEFNGNNLTSGIYFYRLIAGNYIETKKMILVK